MAPGLPGAASAGRGGDAPAAPHAQREGCPLNVVIPLGGTSHEFAAAGYRQPRYLAACAGRPLLFWIVDNLRLRDGDALWIAVPEAVDARYGVTERVASEYPRARARVVRLRFATRGAAETLYCVTQSMAPADLRLPTVSFDCDTVYLDDALAHFREGVLRGGLSLYFDGAAGAHEPLYSYLRLVADDWDSSTRGGAAGDGREEGGGTATNCGAARAAAADENSAVAATTPAGTEDSAGAWAVATPKWAAPHEAARVVAIAEKRAIAPHANTGAYGFTSARMLESYCRRVLAASSPACAGTDVGAVATAGAAAGAQAEYFMSSVIAAAVAAGEPFYGRAVEPSSFVCVGTPMQLRAFVAGLRRDARAAGGREILAAKYPHTRRGRVTFELEGCLVDCPDEAAAGADALDAVRARPGMAELAAEMHAFGHTVAVASTFRGGAGHGGASGPGGVGAATAAAAAAVARALERLEIPYDELYLAQPKSDVYVGAAAVAAATPGASLELGWAVAGDDGPSAAGHAHGGRVASSQQGTPSDAGPFDEGGSDDGGAQATAEAMGGVAARHFNRVMVRGQHVFKTSAENILAGEAYFYRHIPSDVAHLFPRLVSCEEGHVGAAAGSGGSTAAYESESTIVMERVHGITFSHLLVNRCVTPERFRALMSALAALHASSGVPSEPDLSRPPPGGMGSAPSVYANWAAKVESRYAKHREACYMQLPGARDASDTVFAEIMAFLTKYEDGGRADARRAIHGDPVFSNALLTGAGGVVFVDMNGRLGGECCMQGDALYDLSKVYQSLCGYDYVLLDHPMGPKDLEILDSLKSEFRAAVSESWPGVSLRDVEMATASLYFSLLPLHDDPARRAKFWAIAQAITASQTLLSRVLTES